MKRFGPTLLAVAVAASFASVASAAAPSHVGVDRTHGVRFSLTARSLTITLEPVDGAPNPLVAELAGMPVNTACNGVSGTTGKKVVGSVMDATWPTDSSVFKLKLSKDVSAHVKWCLLEHQGTGQDIAVSEKMRVPKPAPAPVQN